MEKNMAEHKSESKAGSKAEAAGAARADILAAVGRAARAYMEEVHEAWVALNNAGRDAQHELFSKMSAGNAAMAGGSAPNERLARAHQTYAFVQRAVAAGGPPEAWQQFKAAQEEYFEANKEASALRESVRSRLEDANQQYAKALKDASAEVQKRYEAAFRAFLAAQQAAFKDLDVNAVAPEVLIEIGRNLIQIGENARVNLPRT
jgi:hypothetical protein